MKSSATRATQTSRGCARAHQISSLLTRRYRSRPRSGGRSTTARMSAAATMVSATSCCGIDKTTAIVVGGDVADCRPSTTRGSADDSETCTSQQQAAFKAGALPCSSAPQQHVTTRCPEYRQMYSVSGSPTCIASAKPSTARRGRSQGRMCPSVAASGRRVTQNRSPSRRRPRGDVGNAPVPMACAITSRPARRRPTHGTTGPLWQTAHEHR